MYSFARQLTRWFSAAPWCSQSYRWRHHQSSNWHRGWQRMFSFSICFDSDLKINGCRESWLSACTIKHRGWKSHQPWSAVETASNIDLDERFTSRLTFVAKRGCYDSDLRIKGSQESFGGNLKGNLKKNHFQIFLTQKLEVTSSATVNSCNGTQLWPKW